MDYYGDEKGEDKYQSNSSKEGKKKKSSKLGVDSKDKQKTNLADDKINGILDYLDEQYQTKSLVPQEELKAKIKELNGNMLNIINYVEDLLEE